MRVLARARVLAALVVVALALLVLGLIVSSDSETVLVAPPGEPVNLENAGRRSIRIDPPRFEAEPPGVADTASSALEAPAAGAADLQPHAEGEAVADPSGLRLVDPLPPGVWRIFLPGPSSLLAVLQGSLAADADLVNHYAASNLDAALAEALWRSAEVRAGTTYYLQARFIIQIIASDPTVSQAIRDEFEQRRRRLLVGLWDEVSPQVASTMRANWRLP